MDILGIDPGTGRTGWGVVRTVQSSIHSTSSSTLSSGPKGSRQEFKVQSFDGLEYIGHGCILTEQDDSMAERLLVLHTSLNKLVNELNPDCVVIERIFFGRNSKTAISVGQARGVVMLSAALRRIPVFEYTGISVKYHLSGNGRADKKDIQKIVRRTLRQTKRKLSFNTKDKAFDDAADALAIAIYHATKG